MQGLGSQQKRVDGGGRAGSVGIGARGRPWEQHRSSITWEEPGSSPGGRVERQSIPQKVGWGGGRSERDPPPPGATLSVTQTHLRICWVTSALGKVPSSWGTFERVGEITRPARRAGGTAANPSPQDTASDGTPSFRPSLPSIC